MWHSIWTYGLIALACWFGIFAVIAIFSKDRSEAAGSSMLPLLIMFFLIMAISQSTSSSQKSDNAWIGYAVPLIAAALIAAVIYWHAEIWVGLVSIFAG